MDRILEMFSTWNIIRLSGFLALFFITFSIGFGMMSKLSWLKKKKALSHFIHLSSAWGSVLSLVFHLSLLLVDTYQPLSIKELLVPFKANYSPVAAGLGTLAFYFIIIIYLSSKFGMKKLKRDTWKKIHFLFIPAWIFALIHGVMIGTDTATLWGIVFYLVCFFTIVLLALLRTTQKPVVKSNKLRTTQKPTVKPVR
jgi:methionine sulfoxide reductase heme-binding subunit